MPYERRGAVQLHNPRIRILAVELSPWIWWASWPFGKIECHEDHITVKAWPLRVSIPLQDIDTVEFRRMGIRRMLLLLGERLEIRHRAGLPNPVVFSWYRLSPLLQFLQQRGVRVITK